MQTTFDRYQHTAESAVRALLDSAALEATLTWDGADNYRVQPSTKYCEADEGHRAILSVADLIAYLDGPKCDTASMTAAAQWLTENQREWFNQAAE